MSEEVRRAALASLDPRRLELILYPTEQCNFRCVYCYEDFSIGKMSADTVNGVKKLIDGRIRGLQQLHLSWFGGEPLLAKEIIFDICDYAKRACDAAGVILTGSTTTNGYFLDLKTVQRLASLGQTSYQVSLDGYGAGHNATRRLASGGATFDRIWANLLGLRDSDLDFQILLRLHVTTANIESVEALADELRLHFLDDRRFSIFIKTIENLGGDIDTAMIVPNQDRQSLHDRIHSRLGKAQRASVGAIDRQSNSPTAPAICYASRPNSLAIRANGAIQKCTVLMHDEVNHVGALLSDGSLELDGKKMAFWMRGYDSSDGSELTCPAHSTPRPGKKVIPIAAVAADQ